MTEGGAAEMLQRLAHTYLGPEVVFPNISDPPPGFVTRITPERLGGVGPWNPFPSSAGSGEGDRGCNPR